MVTIPSLFNISVSRFAYSRYCNERIKKKDGRINTNFFLYLVYLNTCLRLTGIFRSYLHNVFHLAPNCNHGDTCSDGLHQGDEHNSVGSHIF